MRLSPGEKKFVAIVTIVAVLFVAVVATSVAVLTAGHKDDDAPYVQVASGSDLVRVEPLMYCTINLSECDGTPMNKPTRVPVDVDDTLVVSLSADLSVGPWTLIIQYLTKDGYVDGGEVVYRSGSKHTITVPSTKDKILAAIEIKQPSQVEVAGGYAPRGIWGIDTLPDGVEVPAAS